MDRMTSAKLTGYVQILEHLMCFEEFLKTTRTGGIKRSGLPAVSYFVCVLLDTIKIVVDRTIGDGMNLIKNHLIVHMVTDDIPWYASPANVSGSAGECQFKENFKLPASTGQLRDIKFDQQLYIRRYQHLLIRWCAQWVRRAQRRAEWTAQMVNTREPNTTVSEGISDFASQLFHQTTSTDGDLANIRGNEGLSSTVYRVQMVKNKLDCNSSFHPEIVFYGKKDSSRSARFHCPDRELIG